MFCTIFSQSHGSITITCGAFLRHMLHSEVVQSYKKQRMDANIDPGSKELDFDSAWDNFMKEQAFMLENRNENLLNSEESNALSKFLDSLMNEEAQPKEVIKRLDEELHRLNADSEAAHIVAASGPDAGSEATVNCGDVYDESADTSHVSHSEPSVVRRVSESVENLAANSESRQANDVAHRSATKPDSPGSTVESHPLAQEHLHSIGRARSSSPVEYLSQSETLIKMQMDNYQAAYPYVPDPQTFYPPPSYYPTHLSMFKMQQIPSLQMNYQQLFQQILPVYSATPEFAAGTADADEQGIVVDGGPGLESRKRKRSITEEMSRINHVNSEKKRRAHIKEKYQEMCDLIPVVRLSNAKFAKSHVLQAAVDRLIELAAENKRTRVKIESRGISTMSIVEVGLEHVEQGDTSHLLTPANSGASSAYSTSE